MHACCQVVVVLPSNRKDKYDNVKKYLCVDSPVPSQCVVARTLSRPQALMTVATKLALQMACKMGGELWSVEIPVRRRPRTNMHVSCGLKLRVGSVVPDRSILIANLLGREP